ncbi:M1 family metallopeptidase [Pedobacter sp. MC2016-05]|uniref:M1 family metallopeptidase n=1 Tax=Pedobacter sp. MC2016-05 TaxID=2994474 RepID=UPI0022451A65|nr:M1 family metallopeptidase [Pedobacter sp. MC2016-05]MCX2473750.1 M1 family metallopeptidase [Pedobacter sp. MC2016-05]
MTLPHLYQFELGLSSPIKATRVKLLTVAIVLMICNMKAIAQTTLLSQKTKYTMADTLRGSLTKERTWWDVQRYEVYVKPDYNALSIVGSNEIRYKVVRPNEGNIKMQIDLQDPLTIDSVIYNNRIRLAFNKQAGVWYLTVPAQLIGDTNRIKIFYGGKVHRAITPPWDGGFIFAKDSLNRPYMSVACQGLGASIWFPNKDHQSDEPDLGASLTMVVPDSLVAIGNGRLVAKIRNGDGTATYKYNVNNPINNYCIIPYIGKYVNFREVYRGLKGPLDVNYWVLDYNLAKARIFMPDQVHKMFKALEHWFGPYPFYGDGYQLIDAPHTGMEHQSAVSYGNRYAFGYRGRDMSGGYGWGLKFDFIIVHESGHEWFGNNITSKDLADMWIHESFTNYSETLFTEYSWGKVAGNEYNYGTRKFIVNDGPIIPAYQVNGHGSGDMYYKGGNMIHSIRHSINNDKLFRAMLIGMNTKFKGKTVTAKDIYSYINQQAKFNFDKVFEQYLTTTQVPQFDLYFKKNQLFYRYSNCVNGFNLPISIGSKDTAIRIIPSQRWQSIHLTNGQRKIFNPSHINFMYYLNVKEGKG